MFLRVLSFICGACLLVAGCASDVYTPAVIANGRVSQPQVGYNGITFRIPEHYVIYHPAPKGTLSVDNAQWAWSMSTDYDQSAGYTTLEHIPLTKLGYGITVAITRTGWLVPSTKDTAAYDMAVHRAAQDFIFTEGTLAFRDTKRLGDNLVARAARVLPDNVRYNAVYLTIVPPRYVIVVNGVSRTYAKQDLLQDMDSLLASLKVGQSGVGAAPLGDAR